MVSAWTQTAPLLFDSTTSSSSQYAEGSSRPSFVSEGSSSSSLGLSNAAGPVGVGGRDRSLFFTAAPRAPTFHFTTPPISPPVSPIQVVLDLHSKHQVVKERRVTGAAATAEEECSTMVKAAAQAQTRGGVMCGGPQLATAPPSAAGGRHEAHVKANGTGHSHQQQQQQQQHHHHQHQKGGFVPPSMSLDRFFAVAPPVVGGESIIVPTAALSKKVGGGARGVPRFVAAKMPGGGVANSAKGKMAKAKKAKALKAQQLKADKLQASADATRQRSLLVQPSSLDDNEEELDGDDEYDYSSEGTQDQDYYQPPAPAALSPDSIYTFKPLKPLPKVPSKSGSAIGSEDEQPAHVEFAAEKDFVDSTKVETIEAAPAAYTDQRRYSSDSEQHEEEPERDEYRGRSRRPRLLWRSRLSDKTVGVLDHYCREYYSMDLPRLRGQGSPDGKKWSRRLDKAGL